jgi:hypothetical protein
LDGLLKIFDGLLIIPRLKLRDTRRLKPVRPLEGRPDAVHQAPGADHGERADGGDDYQDKCREDQPLKPSPYGTDIVPTFP